MTCTFRGVLVVSAFVVTGIRPSPTFDHRKSHNGTGTTGITILVVPGVDEPR